MALDPVAELIRRLLANQGAWPPRSEKAIWEKVERGRAFAESDRNRLAEYAQWSNARGRPYRVDPLPDRIREAWADHLFGEDLTVTLEDDVDNERLAQIVDENDLTEEARHAVRDYQVPEGEAWWRIYVDRDVADVPLVEWHSRSSIIPYTLGRRLLAASLVTVLEGPGTGTRDTKATVWRLFEIHEDGRVVLALFRGIKAKLGSAQPLDAHPETEELLDAGGLVELAGERRPAGVLAYEWAHSLPMLMGRILNKRGRDPRLGVGEFVSIEDLLLKLNESVAIGWENMRLTAKKRVVVSQGTVRASTTGIDDTLVDDGAGGFERVAPAATFDAGEDVLVSDPLDEELGKDPSDTFKVLEYSYDADPLIADRRDTVETALTRIGLTPQWVGTVTDQGDGYATSGTHYRLRMIVTDKAGRGRARAWDRELPRILLRMAMLDSLEESAGGLGVPWGDLETEPTVERADPVPPDPVETAQVETALVTAGARSVEQSVREQHPDWTEDQVADEVARIREDRASLAPASGF